MIRIIFLQRSEGCAVDSQLCPPGARKRRREYIIFAPQIPQYRFDELTPGVAADDEGVCRAFKQTLMLRHTEILQLFNEQLEQPGWCARSTPKFVKGGQERLCHKHGDMWEPSKAWRNKGAVTQTNIEAKLRSCTTYKPFPGSEEERLHPSLIFGEDKGQIEGETVGE